MKVTVVSTVSVQPLTVYVVGARSQFFHLKNGKNSSFLTGPLRGLD